MVRILIEGSEAEIREKASEIRAEVERRLRAVEQPRPRPRFFYKGVARAVTVPASSAESFSLAAHDGASGSLAGKQAVFSGVVGPNQLFQAPIPDPRPATQGMDFVKEWLKGREDRLAAERARRKKANLAPISPAEGWEPAVMTIDHPPETVKTLGRVKEWIEDQHRRKVDAAKFSPYLPPRS